MKKKMKKKIILLIGLLCLFSLTGCKNQKVGSSVSIGGADGPTSIFLYSLSECDASQVPEESDTAILIEEKVDKEEVDNGIPAAYLAILDKAYDIISSNGDSYNDEEGMSGVWEITIGTTPDENMSKTGYAIIDVDGNGVDELLIFDDGEEGWKNRILVAYTLVNDEANILFEGWARNRYYLLDDNTFYNEGSGGAAYTEFGTYKISDDGKTIEPIDTYFTDFLDTEMQEWGWFYNTTGSVDTAESEWLGTDEENSLFPQMDDMLDRVKDIEIVYFDDYDS